MNTEYQEQINLILSKETFSKEDIVFLLNTDISGRNLIYKNASDIKEKYLGKITYYRGLIEFSNLCRKNCYYCGIRKDNVNIQRYDLDEKSILNAVKFAYENKYGSVVLQAGERKDKQFVEKIDRILRKIKQITNNGIGVTLSLGEQTEETYLRWLESGAHRYLLRIESSNKELYYKIHPKNKTHDFEKRIEALYNLQKLGYQTGTGVMIGLPFQTVENLADDILFFKNFDIDMVGMGPYIEHPDALLFEHENILLPIEERFNLSMKMIAILRIFMKDINIAAATALQAIDPIGREKAIKVGANVIMPNITPSENRKNYLLYDNKPCIDEGADDCNECLEARINISGDKIAYGKRGDSKHYLSRVYKKN